MHPIDQILCFIEEGGAFMYPILLIGLITNGLHIHYRAWQGPRAPVPLRRRLVVALLGTFGALVFALCGFVVNVIITIGAIADPTLELVFKSLAEGFNLIYLGGASALMPSVVMLRAVFFELGS